MHTGIVYMWSHQHLQMLVRNVDRTADVSMWYAIPLWKQWLDECGRSLNACIVCISENSWLSKQKITLPYNPNPRSGSPQFCNRDRELRTVSVLHMGWALHSNHMKLAVGSQLVTSQQRTSVIYEAAYTAIGDQPCFVNNVVVWWLFCTASKTWERERCYQTACRYQHCLKICLHGKQGMLS